MSDRRELLRHISEDLKRNTESLVINHIEHDSQTYLAVNKPNCNIVNIIIPYIFGNKVDFAEVCNIEKSLLPDGQKTVTVAICNEAGTVLYYKMKDLQYF